MCNVLVLVVCWLWVISVLLGWCGLVGGWFCCCLVVLCFCVVVGLCIGVFVWCGWCVSGVLIMLVVVEWLWCVLVVVGFFDVIVLLCWLVMYVWVWL